MQSPSSKDKFEIIMPAASSSKVTAADCLEVLTGQLMPAASSSEQVASLANFSGIQTVTVRNLNVQSIDKKQAKSRDC